MPPFTGVHLHMKASLKGALIGASLSTLSLLAWDASHAIARSPEPSTQAQSRPLQPFEVDPSWVRTGTPNFRAAETARSADGRHISGLWACDGPTTFQWTFGLDETVHLLEGEVHVEYEGRKFVLRPGDTATFLADTKAVWHVPKGAKKSFTLHHPGQVARLWRWIDRAMDEALATADTPATPTVPNSTTALN